MEAAARVVERLLELRLMELEGEEGMSIGCAVANMPTLLASAFVDTNFVAERMDTAVFAAAQALTQRVCPSPLALTPDWWVKTCSDLDITSVRLSLVMHLVQYSKLFDQRQLQSARRLT